MASGLLLCKSAVGGIVTVVVAGTFLSTPASAAAPLMKDFIGLNGHSYGFDSSVYSPVSSLVRDYHPMSWDVGSNTSTATKFPLGNAGWPNWNTDQYGPWVADGFRVNLDIQFETIQSNAWTNMAADSYKYGQEVAAYFGSVKTNGTGGTRLATSVEIGNEPSTLASNGAYTDAQFVTVYRNMAQGIRAGDASLPIVTCNVNVGASTNYSKSVSLFKTNNITSLVDVYATHTYPFLTGWPTYEKSYPEDTRLTYLTDVQDLMNWVTTNDPGKKVWVTEFGYDATSLPTGTSGGTTFMDVTDKQQAQYLVRSYLAFAEMGVDRAYMYYYNDSDQASVHAASGLTRNGVPKPSFHAIAHMQSTLGSHRFTEAVQETAGSLYVHAYTDGTDPSDIIWVIWSPTGSDRSQTVTLSDLPGIPVSAERMPLAGGAAPAVSFTQPGANQVRLTIGESPIYLHMTVVPEPASVAVLGLAGLSSLLRRRRGAQ